MASITTIFLVLLSVVAPSLATPMNPERAKWLEVMARAGEPDIYVGEVPPDMEFSGDLPGGLQGSGEQPPIKETEPDVDLTDILIAIDRQQTANSFIQSSSFSSSIGSSSIASINEASASEYDGIDSEPVDNDVEYVPDQEADGEPAFKGDNELGVGGAGEEMEAEMEAEVDAAVVDKGNEIGNELWETREDPNTIPDAFKNGAHAETGPETDMNIISTRAKEHPREDNPIANDAAVEGRQSKIAGEGDKPPNVLKYTAVIGVVMVAGAVGLGALLSALGFGAVRVVKGLRRGKVEEA